MILFVQLNFIDLFRFFPIKDTMPPGIVVIDPTVLMFIWRSVKVQHLFFTLTLNNE